MFSVPTLLILLTIWIWIFFFWKLEVSMAMLSDTIWAKLCINDYWALIEYHGLVSPARGHMLAKPAHEIHLSLFFSIDLYTWFGTYIHILNSTSCYPGVVCHNYIWCLLQASFDCSIIHEYDPRVRNLHMSWYIHTWFSFQSNRLNIQTSMNDDWLFFWEIFPWISDNNHLNCQLKSDIGTQNF